MKAWPAPGADAMAPEASCQTGAAAAAAPAQGRLRQTLREHDARSERTMAAAQAAISCFVLALHLLAQIGNPWQSLNPWIVGALGALVASSAIRSHNPTAGSMRRPSTATMRRSGPCSRPIWNARAAMCWKPAAAPASMW